MIIWVVDIELVVGWCWESCGLLFPCDGVLVTWKGAMRIGGILIGIFVSRSTFLDLRIVVATQRAVFERERQNVGFGVDEVSGVVLQFSYTAKASKKYSFPCLFLTSSSPSSSSA